MLTRLLNLNIKVKYHKVINRYKVAAEGVEVTEAADPAEAAAAVAGIAYYHSE